MKCGNSILNAMSRHKQLDLFAFDLNSRQEPAFRPVAGVAPPPPAASPAVPTPRPPTLAGDVRWREVYAPSQVIGYALRRSRRKSIGLVINDDGLQVTAPSWVTLAQVDAVVLEKAAWVLEKLRLRQERQEQLATADTQWQDGGRIPYLGKRIELRLGDAPDGPVFEGLLHAPEQGDILRLPLPRHADRDRVRDSAHGWLQLQATEWLGQRLDRLQRSSGLAATRWRLSSAATRWGSCNSEGHIMLNWRLIHFEPAVIDYVVAHELAHLRHMNHSAAFWREVERILPGFEVARNALRRHSPTSLPLL